MVHISPFLEFSRKQWCQLAHQNPPPLSEYEIEKLRGLDTPLNLCEVQEIYVPLAHLIHLQFHAKRHLYDQTRNFTHSSQPEVPFILALAGSVGVGKSTTARVLQALLQRWEESPQVDLVTTDGFLYPNEVLESRNLMLRKGFPESYDRQKLLQFVSDLKSGKTDVKAPEYSHILYDIIPDYYHTINQPDILILEGLNVLQTGPHLMVSDFFDFSLYLDAPIHYIKNWYIHRFSTLISHEDIDPRSPFAYFATMESKAAIEFANKVWEDVNLPNLLTNILPTRPRASVILEKGADHSIQKIQLRKI